MSVNLLNLFKSYFDDNLISGLSSFLGENERGTSSALEQILPTLLGGLMAKGQTAQGANSLFNMLKNPDYDDSSLLDTLKGALLGGSGSSQADSFLRFGSSALSNIFGDKVGGIIDLVSGASGTRKESSANLLSFLAPLAISLLGKVGKSQGGSWGVGSLLSLLLSQKDLLKGVLPSGLLGLLGFSSFDGLTSGLQSNLSQNFGSGSTSTSSASTSYSSSTSSASQEEEKKGGMSWLLPLLLALLLGGGALYALKGCNGKKEAIEGHGSIQKAADAAGQAATDAANATGQAATDAANAAGQAANAAGQAVSSSWDAINQKLGGLGAHKLSSGIELNIPKNGVESRLITFIEDKTKAVDKTTWFDFDRLLFETNQSTLKPESQEQLKNVSEILKAFPQVEIKLGGYTDNTGDAKANLKLSGDRATSVLNELVKMGIDGKRLKAEGYGQEHPVADNSTPEGREQNRRVSIRVTKK